MYVSKIFLKNFRNYSASVVSFADGVNMIVGNNAQGKTNLLESIYFCALGKSPRISKDNLLINFEKDAANISLNFNTLVGEKNIDITIYKKGKKQISINNATLTKTSSLIGSLKVVYFSPDELRLIKEVPEDRRRFLDIAISQLDKNYLHSLVRYEKVLKQRNAILKRHLDKNEAKKLLEIWTPQFILLSKTIIIARKKFVENINQIASEIHKKLCPTENITLVYTNTDSDEMIEKNIAKKLENNFEKEYEIGYTLTGPHRDDIGFFINGKDCKTFCSQGQQRSIALSVKLAEMEIFKSISGEYPVLLLDDVMSELDDNRQNNLLKFISKYQTLITSTTNVYKGKHKKIMVENGNVKYN